MSEKTCKTEGTSNNQSCQYYPYPPCYEPKENCDTCPYKDKCTKKYKPYPYYPIPWYPQPIWFLDLNELPTYGCFIG